MILLILDQRTVIFSQIRVIHLLARQSKHGNTKIRSKLVCSLHLIMST